MRPATTSNRRTSAKPTASPTPKPEISSAVPKFKALVPN